MEDLKKQIKDFKKLKNLLCNKQVIVTCSICGKKYTVTEDYYNKKRGQLICVSCASKQNGLRVHNAHTNKHLSNITKDDLQEFYKKYYKLALYYIKQEIREKDNLDAENILNEDMVRLCWIVKEYGFKGLKRGCIYSVMKERDKLKREVLFENLHPSIRAKYVSDVEWE